MSATSLTPLTPLRFLERSAEVYPDKTAIVHGERRSTYRDFAREATRVARAMQASGIERGDRIAYLCPNIPELLIAHFAVPLAGAVLVAINTRLASEEVRYICDHSGAKLMVVDAHGVPSTEHSAPPPTQKRIGRMKFWSTGTKSSRSTRAASLIVRTTSTSANPRTRPPTDT